MNHRAPFLDLLASGSPDQVLELATTLRGTPLPAPGPALVRAVCATASGEGVGWALVSSGPEPSWHRALLVSEGLARWADTVHATQPVSAWLARQAVQELAAHLPPAAAREQPAVRAGRAVAHGLLAGTAELLRLHLPSAEARCTIDLVGEDRADWQRSTPDHRAALLCLTAAWIAVRLPAR